MKELTEAIKILNYILNNKKHFKNDIFIGTDLEPTNIYDYDHSFYLMKNNNNDIKFKYKIINTETCILIDYNRLGRGISIDKEYFSTETDEDYFNMILLHPYMANIAELNCEYNYKFYLTTDYAYDILDVLKQGY